MSLTRITDLTPGDTITLPDGVITLKWVDPYGGRETVLTDTEGRPTILSNDNWFEVA